MENIFENAKFGDKFRTRDGRMVIFVKSEGTNNFHPDVEAECILEEFSYVIIDKSHPMLSKGSRCFSDGTNIYEHSDEDIVGKWEKPVDEEKLHKYAEEYYINHGDIPPYANTDTVWKQIKDAFEDGYRKAKEN